MTASDSAATLACLIISVINGECPRTTREGGVRESTRRVVGLRGREHGKGSYAERGEGESRVAMLERLLDSSRRA